MSEYLINNIIFIERNEVYLQLFLFIIIIASATFSKQIIIIFPTQNLIQEVPFSLFIFSLLPIVQNRITFKWSVIAILKMQYNKPDSDSQLLKILIIGNSGVGKSCMLMRYVENNFTTAFYNTIGVDFKMKNIEIDGKKIRLQIWDTAGQDRFRTITSTYYKGAHGIMIVYDITDRESFDGLRFWLQEIDKYASENVDKLIVGNKSDQGEKRKVSFDQAYQMTKNYKLQNTEVSALSAENIGKAFELLARKVLKRLNSTPQTTINKIPQRLEPKKPKDNSGGCC